MAKAHRFHDEAIAEMFRKDPALAADYLNDVLATGDEVDLMMALRYLSDAFGGVQEIARRADANPNTMYRTLSEQGNPSLKTLRAILSAMGLRLAVQAID
jgi:probable addiction module antidote protein